MYESDNDEKIGPVKKSTKKKKNEKIWNPIDYKLTF